MCILEVTMRYSVLLPLFLWLFSGCTAKYQDLLRDRDAQIRELNDQLADLRAANADLERREREARERLGELREDLAAKAAGATARPEGKDLERVRKDLPDLDVRYDRGRISIGIDSTVTFESGSIALKKSAHRVLRRVAEVLKSQFPNRRIYVEGHTDSDPIRRTKGRFRSNRHLSAERADIVAEFLVRECGIPANRIVVVGYGEHRPRVAGTSRAAKAKNRRVEIVVGEPM